MWCCLRRPRTASHHPLGGGKRSKETVLDAFLRSQQVSKGGFASRMSDIDSNIGDEMQTLEKLARVRAVGVTMFLRILL